MLEKAAKNAANSYRSSFINARNRSPGPIYKLDTFKDLGPTSKFSSGPRFEQGMRFYSEEHSKNTNYGIHTTIALL